jgi:hypothetical protein
MQLNPDEFNTVKGWHIRGRRPISYCCVMLKMVLPDTPPLQVFRRDQTKPMSLKEFLHEGCTLVINPTEREESMKLDDYDTANGWHMRGRYLEYQGERGPARMRVKLPDGDELLLYHRDQTRPATLEEGLAEGGIIDVIPPIPEPEPIGVDGPPI